MNLYFGIEDLADRRVRRSVAFGSLTVTPVIDVRQAWRRHPRFADLTVSAAAAALTLLVARAQQEGLYVYPQLVRGAANEALYRVLPIGWENAGQGVIVSLLACAALCWRKQHPVGVTVVLLILSMGWPLAVPVLIALFTVATTCSARITGWITAVALLPVPAYLLLTPYLGALVLATAVSAATLVAGAVGWGLAVAGLRERAVRAEAEAALRTRQAQREAREEIAREMHDVLAHRLSLLTMHAGALEYHPAASPAQIAEAVGVIRRSAGQALEDLQDVLRVLRAPQVTDHAEPPQPTMQEVTQLISEARAAGTELHLTQQLDDPATMAPSIGRTAYRVLQEALTNHRKHSPSTPVRLSLTGTAQTGLSIQVTNPLQSASITPAVGSGHGLTGMKERVALAGGRLQHRTTPTDFRLDVWLPWTA